MFWSNICSPWHKKQKLPAGAYRGAKINSIYTQSSYDYNLNGKRAPGRKDECLYSNKLYYNKSWGGHLILPPVIELKYYQINIQSNYCV